MDIRKIISVSACALALSLGATALADGALPEATATVEAAVVVPSSVHGGQVLDTGDQYYIAISELPACANGAVLVYDKTTGELATLATASNISQLVYADQAIYALTPVVGGVCLIRITDKCEALTTAGVIDQLSVYEGRLYFLADGKFTSINPDGSDLRTHSALNMGQYAIVDDTVYFTNMDDAKTYTVNSKLQGQPLSFTAGCLYSLNLNSGVQVKLLSDGVKSIKALGGDIYLQNMGESYVATIGDTEQPMGRLSKFDPATRKLEREASQNEYSYFPTTGGLICHTDYDLALYTNNVYTMSLYKPESGSSVYSVDESSVMVYEPVAQRLTLVSADLNVGNLVIYSNGDTPEQSYTRPTLSPMSTAQATAGAATPAPTVKPTERVTAKPVPTEGIIFADSATRRLTEKEVRALKNSQLIYARYEILARNGYVFNDTKYLEYYRQFDWYVEDPSFKFGDLDTIESYNYELLRAIMNDIFATPTPKPTEKPTPRPTPVYSKDFIFPDSSREKLTRQQVLNIDVDDLLEARYEILARNGYVFETKSWQRYYEKKDWYSPNPDFAFGDMNEIESYNYELIRAIDKEINATPAPTSAPDEYEFIFPDALERKLSRDEVLSIDTDDLLKARYEILARKGYVFETQSWARYFEKQSWYTPNPDFAFGDMNEIESYNYELIRAIDKEINATPAPTSAPDEYEFIFPDALERKLSRDDVLAIDTDDLLKARYEILARKGYVFETQSWARYFEKQSWYTPNPDFAFGDMNEIESYNYELIRAIDKEINGGESTPEPEETPSPTVKPDEPDATSHPTPPAPTDPADAILLPGADVYEITLGDIMTLPVEMRTPEMLTLMRDEILARHGYVFDTDTNEGLASDAYFRTLNWYSPDAEFDPTAEDALNEFERLNYDLMQRILDGEYGDPMEWETVG